MTVPVWQPLEPSRRSSRRSSRKPSVTPAQQNRRSSRKPLVSPAQRKSTSGPSTKYEQENNAPPANQASVKVHPVRN